MSWYVIRTNIKCEKKAEREIRALGFDVYLPEYKVERFNRRKRVSIVNTLCLFPRYMFVQAPTVNDLSLIRGCNGVEEFLPGRPLEPQPVPAADVLDLRQAQADLKLDDTDEARRHRGETPRRTLAAMRKRLKDKRIRITDGPFASFPGTVEKVESLERLRVLIEIFCRETPVDLQVGQFEEIDQASEAA